MTRVAYWVDRLANSRHGLVLMFWVSFLEATVLPVPLELILIPYMLKARHFIWRIAAAALLGCVFAATLGYYIGAVFFDTAGAWLLETFNLTAQFENYREEFQRKGFWAILIFGLTPLQFQIAMLAAGAANYPLVLFWLATIIARGTLYYGVGLLITLFGDQAVALWNRLPRRVVAVVVGLAVLVYLLITLV